MPLVNKNINFVNHLYMTSNHVGNGNFIYQERQFSNQFPLLGKDEVHVLKTTHSFTIDRLRSPCVLFSYKGSITNWTIRHEKSSGLLGFSGFFIFQTKNFPLDVILFIGIWGADIPSTPFNNAKR